MHHIAHPSLIAGIFGGGERRLGQGDFVREKGEKVRLSSARERCHVTSAILIISTQAAGQKPDLILTAFQFRDVRKVQ